LCHCDAYRYRQKPQQEVGKTPIVPVVYIQPPQKCGAKDLFQEIIEYLKFKATKGTVSDFRGRTMEVLKGCGVEMIIIDEADRIKPETFADVRDIYDKLGIAVVLVGTDRLEAVIKRDEQVYNRFRACHRFGKLSGKDFQDTVQAWEDNVPIVMLGLRFRHYGKMERAIAVGCFLGGWGSIRRLSRCSVDKFIL